MVDVVPSPIHGPDPGLRIKWIWRPDNLSPQVRPAQPQQRGDEQRQTLYR